MPTHEKIIDKDTSNNSKKGKGKVEYCISYVRYNARLNVPLPIQAIFKTILSTPQKRRNTTECEYKRERVRRRECEGGF